MHQSVQSIALLYFSYLFIPKKFLLVAKVGFERVVKTRRTLPHLKPLKTDGNIMWWSVGGVDGKAGFDRF